MLIPLVFGTLTWKNGINTCAAGRLHKTALPNRPLRLLSAVGIGQHLPALLFSTGLYLVTLLPVNSSGGANPF